MWMRSGWTVISMVASACLLAASAVGAAEAWKLSLLDADAAVLAQAKSQAIQQGLARAVVVREQSFTLRAADGARSPAFIVSLRGQVTTPTGDNAACGVAVVSLTAAEPQILLTVGTGQWEAQSCLGVEAVGLLRLRRADAAPSLALIYRAASANAATREPVVLRWDPELKTLAIDPEATASASRAGATTIKAIAAATR